MRVLTRKAKAGGNPVRSNMLRDITLGQYYQTESVIHKMDPRVKLGGTLLFIISLFFFKNYAGYVIAALFLGMVIRLSKVPFRFMVKGMKTIVMLMMITVVFNNLTDGMEKMMGPLKVFKVPVHEVAMMMSIALRFIPILLEETDKIMKAQIARGADFESGNIFKRAKAMVPLLVPLFISAFRRANDLAMAMEARCYRGGEGRTKMKPLVYHKRDYIAYGCIVAYMVVSIVVGRLSFLP